MIDPKELRIDSHINVSGERVEVDEIINNTQIGYITQKGDWQACDPRESWIEPIPLTPELLLELGFDKRETNGLYAKEYAPDSYIFVMCYENKQICRVNLYPQDFRQEMTFVCKNLHELEAFLYLAAKTELIKEYD